MFYTKQCRIPEDFSSISGLEYGAFRFSLSQGATALYGLKQAPRVWYKCLTKFLIEKGFEIGKIDSTLFTKRVNGELFVCQIYVDDIIFGSTNPNFSEKFGRLMSEKFEMSMMMNSNSFLVCKSNKLRKVPLSLKRSTPRTYSRSSTCKKAKV